MGGGSVARVLRLIRPTAVRKRLRMPARGRRVVPSAYLRRKGAQRVGRHIQLNEIAALRVEVVDAIGFGGSGGRARVSVGGEVPAPSTIVMQKPVPVEPRNSRPRTSALFKHMLLRRTPGIDEQCSNFCRRLQSSEHRRNLSGWE